MLRLVAASADLPHDADVACPICGYDLRGRLLTPAGNATANAMCCPECGVEIGDGEALGIGRAGPAWWVEAAVGRGAIARAACESALRAHSPRRLWSSLRPGHAKRPVRLLWMVLAAWLALGAVLAVNAGVHSFQMKNRALPFGVRLQSAVLEVLGGGSGEFHFEATSAPDQSWRVHAVFRSSAWSAAMTETHLILGVFVVSMAVGSTLAFAFLPSSRRRAGVQWSHIARAGAVMLATAPAAAIVARALFLWARHPAIPLLQTFVALAMLLGWLLLWWHAAASRYFAMERPIAVAFAVSAVGFLAGVAATTPWVLR